MPGYVLSPYTVRDGFYKLPKWLRIINPVTDICFAFPYIIKVLRENNRLSAQLVGNHNIGKVKPVLLGCFKLFCRCRLNITIQIPEEIEDLIQFLSGRKTNLLPGPDIHTDNRLRHILQDCIDFT